METQKDGSDQLIGKTPRKKPPGGRRTIWRQGLNKNPLAASPRPFLWKPIALLHEWLLNASSQTTTDHDLSHGLGT